jgi:type II secretory pathway pseudopilin PulG
LTLLEIVIGITILVAGILGMIGAMIHSMSTLTATREAALATQAARRTIETVEATEFRRIFALYNADPLDDPDGPGTAPGSGFDVAGLSAVPGDPDGRVGQILFPATAAAPGVLRENVADRALGMPRDLNGDGDPDGLDHSADYRLLPVVVRMAWRGSSGTSSIEFKSLLVDL